MHLVGAGIAAKIFVGIADDKNIIGKLPRQRLKNEQGVHERGFKPHFTALVAVVAHVPLAAPVPATPVVPVHAAVYLAVQQVAPCGARRGEPVFCRCVLLLLAEAVNKSGIGGDRLPGFALLEQLHRVLRSQAGEKGNGRMLRHDQIEIPQPG